MPDATPDGIIEGGVPAASKEISFLRPVISSEGGPGEWRTVREGMKPHAAAYQFQITGRRNKAYIVNGVKFDGYSEGVLLEAKGPGYAGFLKNGEFRKRLKTRKKLLMQARNQSRVANGVPITWRVAEATVADAIRSLLREENIRTISVIYTSVAYGKAGR